MMGSDENMKEYSDPSSPPLSPLTPPSELPLPRPASTAPVRTPPHLLLRWELVGKEVAAQVRAFPGTFVI